MMQAILTIMPRKHSKDENVRIRQYCRSWPIHVCQRLFLGLCLADAALALPEVGLKP